MWLTFNAVKSSFFLSFRSPHLGHLTSGADLTSLGPSLHTAAWRAATPAGGGHPEVLRAPGRVAGVGADREHGPLYSNIWRVSNVVHSCCVHQEVSLPDLTCVNLKMSATFLLYTLTHTIKPGHHASTIYGTNNTIPEIVTNSDSHRE